MRSEPVPAGEGWFFVRSDDHKSLWENEIGEQEWFLHATEPLIPPALLGLYRGAEEAIVWALEHDNETALRAALSNNLNTIIVALRECIASNSPPPQQDGKEEDGRSASTATYSGNSGDRAGPLCDVPHSNMAHSIAAASGGGEKQSVTAYWKADGTQEIVEHPKPSPAPASEDLEGLIERLRDTTAAGAHGKLHDEAAAALAGMRRMMQRQAQEVCAEMEAQTEAFAAIERELELVKAERQRAQQACEQIGERLTAAQSEISTLTKNSKYYNELYKEQHRLDKAELDCAKIEISTLTKRVEELEAGLEFYANPETYVAIGFFPDHPCGAFAEDFDEQEIEGLGTDFRPGKLARTLLTKGRGE